MSEPVIRFEEVLGSTTTDKRVEILRSIHQVKSISEAARVNGVSYKAAWQAVETLSNLAGVPLIDKAVGGSGGGGTQLTAAGLQVLDAADMLNSARREAMRRIHGQGIGQDGGHNNGTEPRLGNLASLGLRTSMRNQIPCAVSDLQKERGTVRVTLELADGQRLVSRITQESLELLGLSTGMPVLALCKATAVTVAPTIVAVGNVNLLKGKVARRSVSADDRQVSLALSAGLQLAGFADPQTSLRLRQPAMAAIEESAIVIALPS